MIKKLCCIAGILALLAACSLLPRYESRGQVNRITPLSFDPPEPERIVLENGMVIYLLEDHELPLIQVTASIRTGSIYEPPELAGLAGLTGSVMRTGGTTTLSAELVDLQLENMSAIVTVGIGLEQGMASLSVLREDFQQAFSLYSQILQHPVFQQEKINIARTTVCQSLRQVPDNPQSLAFREFKKLLYAENPRGVQPSLASVNRIRRKDMLAFHARFFRPENIMLAVSGDFNRGNMLALIKKQFSNWPKTAEPAAHVAAPAPVMEMKTYYLHKKIPQSTIIVGQFAPPNTDSDIYAFKVIDFILGGGGFTSRLFSRVRTEHGLAYSVGSFYRGAPEYGVFGAYCITKAGSTHQALALMVDILEKIKGGEISEQDLAMAKQSLLNNFIFSFTSSAQIITQQMQLEYDRLPSDFLRTAPEKIRALTLADIQRVARTWLNPDKMVVLVIGDDLQFDVKTAAWQWSRVQTITSDIIKQ